MVLRKCSVSSCQSTTGGQKQNGVYRTLYSFPKNEKLRKKWIKACHRKIENIQNARVCSAHFKADDYLSESRLEETPDQPKRKRLKPDAVPTLNLKLKTLKKTEKKQSELVSKNIKTNDSVENSQKDKNSNENNKPLNNENLKNTENLNVKVDIVKHKIITYRSVAEMQDNVDLLKYLSYLKAKSDSTNQPVLVWVD